MSKYGLQKSPSVITSDVRVIGGDVIGSDEGLDTKLSLTTSRAQLVVDDSVRVDAQPTSVAISVGVGQGLTVGADGATVLAMPLRTVTASTTMLATDGIVCCDTSGGAITVTLPDPGTIADGRFFYVADLGSAGTNPITIECGTANTGGAASYTINFAREKAAVVSRSSEWLVF